MTAHAKDALRSPGITEVVYFALAVAAAEARRTECLVARKNGKVFDLVAACAAAISAVVANQGAVAQQQQVGVGVEEGPACVAAEAV